jgi:hypothetical protein
MVAVYTPDGAKIVSCSAAKQIVVVIPAVGVTEARVAIILSDVVKPRYF